MANFEMISNRSTLQLIRLTTKNIFQTVIIHTVYDIFFRFFIFVMKHEDWPNLHTKLLYELGQDELVVRSIYLKSFQN